MPPEISVRRAIGTDTAIMPEPLQSCDQCHARRKRCDRQKPCSLCCKSELPCTYVRRLGKRGRKGKIMQRLRAEAESSSSNQLVLADEATLQMPFGFDLLDLSLFESISNSSTSLPPPVSSIPDGSLVPSGPVIAGLSRSDIDSFVKLYFDHIHPCYPLLERQWFLNRLHSSEISTDPDDPWTALVLTICALTMAFCSNVLRQCDTADFRDRRQKVMSDAILRHYSSPLDPNSTLEQVVSGFLLGLYFGVVHGDRAGHLRIAQSVQLAKCMGLHRRETYLNMDATARRRALGVFAIIVASNRACVLREGFSEVVALEHDPFIADLCSFTGPAPDIGVLDNGLDTMPHLARIIRLYEIVSPNFARCARGMCDLQTCELASCSIATYTQHLENAAMIMPAASFETLRPFFSPLEETRWIEFLVGYRWLASFTWRIASRHNIDLKDIEGGKYEAWPLLILDIAQVLASARKSSIHVLGSGIIHRLGDITASALSYIASHTIESGVLEEASANLRTISEAIEGWDPKHWTRCIF